MVALSTTQRAASICATDALWDPWESSFDSLLSRTTTLLRQDRVVDALLHAIDATSELDRQMRAAARAAKPPEG